MFMYVPTRPEEMSVQLPTKLFDLNALSHPTFFLGLSSACPGHPPNLNLLPPVLHLSTYVFGKPEGTQDNALEICTHTLSKLF